MERIFEGLRMIFPGLSVFIKPLIDKGPASLAFLLLFPGAIHKGVAQEPSQGEWKKIITLNAGYPPGSINWEYSHPSYDGSGGVQTLTETGSFRSKPVFKGQFELSKGFFGFSAGAGFFPAEIKVDKNEAPFEIKSFFLEIEGLFFPLKDPTAMLVPLIHMGTGGVLSSGDLDNTAFFVSFGGGLRTFFTKRFGMSFMFEGRHFTYFEIPLDESISGDIRFTNLTIQLGAMYTF